MTGRRAKIFLECVVTRYKRPHLVLEQGGVASPALLKFLHLLLSGDRPLWQANVRPVRTLAPSGARQTLTWLALSKSVTSISSSATLWEERYLTVGTEQTDNLFHDPHLTMGELHYMTYFAAASASYLFFSPNSSD